MIAFLCELFSFDDLTYNHNDSLFSLIAVSIKNMSIEGLQWVEAENFLQFTRSLSIGFPPDSQHLSP